MSLNAYAAEKRLRIFDELKKGIPPSEGRYDETSFREAKVKGHPQMGLTRYEPHAIHVEFIYPDPLTTSQILTITLDPPERIVFLPVPEWVVESIWQGSVDGSYHFESDARTLVSRLVDGLEPEANVKWFGPRQAMRRE